MSTLPVTQPAPDRPATGRPGSDPSHQPPAHIESRPAAGTPDRTTGRPVLLPGVRVLWRSADEVQLELGDRAVIIDGAAPALVSRLVERGVSGGSDAVADEDLGDLLADLRAAGFAAPMGSIPAGRLAPDLLALAARGCPDPDEVITRRRSAHVVLHGEGRVPAVLAGLLAAAGVGRVHYGRQSGESDGAATVSLLDACPGGLRPEDEGRRFGVALADAVRRAAPETRTVADPGRGPDLVVAVCHTTPSARLLSSDLAVTVLVRRIPLLVVGSWAGTVSVGPLVVPGRSSCLRCADLHRSDRDPAWAALAVQLHEQARRRPHSQDTVGSHLAATIGAAQALEWLDGGGDRAPITLCGTLEATSPDWRLRRRSWPVHPGCPCGGTDGIDVPSGM